MLAEMHQKFVFSVAFSHDGIRIVSGSSDGSVRVWDAIFVTPELQGHGGEVWSDSYLDQSSYGTD